MKNALYILAAASLFSNNTLVPSPVFPTLLFVDTSWHITYPSAIRRALLNDATPSPSCPKGHCFSLPIPGTPGHRLRHVADAQLLPPQAPGVCLYEGIRDVWLLGVERGMLGRFSLSGVPAEPVVAFMRDGLRSVYPVLEVGMIVGVVVALLALMVGKGCTRRWRLG